MSFENISSKKTDMPAPPHGGLCLDPPERIEFKQQLLDKSVKLIIKNPTQKRIAFKISATNPQRYRIRPSRAILYPGQSAKIEICLRTATLASPSNKKVTSKVADTSITDTNTTTTTASTSESESQVVSEAKNMEKFDFKNDRFEVKYFYFDEQDRQHQTSDTDTISIFDNKSDADEPDDQRIELDNLNIISVVISILLISILVYFVLKSTRMPNVFGDFY
jgi:hypothetical protein